jgi:3-isopropylmalate/(R)-2-methylmalate dehydratase small subunit
VQGLLEALRDAPGSTIGVDLPGQAITGPKGEIHRFEIDPFAKTCLLEGLDEVALTLKSAGEVDRYERERKKVTPWHFGDLPG